MPFYQAAAPIGWTKQTAVTNYMMRVINDTSGGTYAGTDSPIFNNKVTSHNHDITIVDSDLSHTHTWAGTSTDESVVHTHAHTGTTSSDGDHAHTMFKNKWPGTGGQYVTMNTNTASFLLTDAGTPTSGKTATTGAHTHTVSGTTENPSVSHTHDVSGTTSAMSANDIHGHTASSAANAGSSDWAPKYLNVIIAVKD